MESEITAHCRICGQKAIIKTSNIKSYGNYKLQQCSYCKTVIVDSRPTSDSLQAAYDKLFSDGAYKQHRDEHQRMLAGNPGQRRYQSRILRKIKRIAPGFTMVEVGGGTGAFGVIASSEGWSYSNYDVSKVAVDFVRELGLPAYHFEESELPPIPKSSTDVIVMWEVLEHIWSVHQYLLQLRQALRPNGLLLISTPNLGRRGYISSLRMPGLGSPPIHLNFFTQESLEVSLRKAGFTYIDFFDRRLYRPQPNFRSVIRHIKIAFGTEATKTLYAVARC